MARIEQSIEINAPVRTVYQRLLQFEEYPRFMQGVHAVRRLDDTHLHWRADIGGKETEWNAEITEQVDERSIAWRNTSGPKSEGKASFEAIAPDKTLVKLEMEAETAALRHPDAIGSKTPKGEHDLSRFKKMIESEQQTGAEDKVDTSVAEAQTTPRAERPQVQQSPAGKTERVENHAAGATVTSLPLRAGRRNIDRPLTGAVESPRQAYAAFMPPFLQAWEEPFALMRRMGEEMEQFFGHWSGHWGGRGTAATATWPPVDITQQGDQWLVCADLPGIRKEDVQVEISGALLTITGERHADQAQQQPYRRSERHHGHFYRAVDLPASVDADAVRASMHDGVLEITVPLSSRKGEGHRVDVQR